MRLISLFFLFFSSIFADHAVPDALFRLAVKFLQTTDESTVSSPFSLAMALGNLNIGARGAASEEITQRIFGGSDKNEVNEWFSDTLPSLEKVRIASKLLIQDQYDVNQTFVSDSIKFYNVEVEKTDFKSNPAEIVRRINAYVSKATNGEIKAVITDGMIRKETKLVIINALYLAMEFQEPFIDGTVRKPFYKENGAVDKVETMHATVNGSYFDASSFQYASFPLSEKNYSFFVLLPKLKRSLKEFLGNLSGTEHSFHAISSKTSREVTLEVALPKFTVEGEFGRSDLKEHLGLTKLFDINVDLSGISPNGDQLTVDQIVHKAKIELNEFGVTASAVTMIASASYGALPIAKNHLILNRPFVYGIAYKETPLFVGKYCGR